MGRSFRDWRETFCVDLETCTVEEAVHFTLYNDLDEEVTQLGQIIDLYVREVLELEWIRPNLIEIKPGYRKNLQRHLEQLGRTDEMAKKMAKDFQTYLNKTQQAQLVYKGILEWYDLAIKEREDRQKRQKYLDSTTLSDKYRTGLIFPEFKDIIGEYSIPNSDFGFIITNDPPEILFKSQGRAWEGNSCERFTGAYNHGFHTDISWGNLIVFIYDRDGVAVARKMLRWAYGPNKEIALNMEPRWYYDPEDKMLELYDIVDEMIIDMINDLGYYQPTSVTPYEYIGFSDAEGDGITKIHYVGPAKINIDPETPYLIHYPAIIEGQVLYNQTDVVNALNILQSEVRYLLAYGFTWASLREASQYIINYMEHDYIGEIEIVVNIQDLKNLIDRNIVAYKLDNVMKLEHGEWIIDTTHPLYTSLTKADEELFHEQALKLMKAFRADFEDYKLYFALFHQYSSQFAIMNKNGGMYTEAIHTRWSWIGNLAGGTIFYDKDRSCLVTAEDTVYQTEVIVPIIDEKGSQYLALRMDMD